MIRKCLCVISVAITVATALDLYPWGKFDFNEHAADVLDRLREHEHLSVWDSTISKSLLSSQAERLSLKNVEGNTFELNAQPTTTPIDPADAMKERARYDVQIFLEELSESCAMIIDGYWSYEYCFRKEVKQFHLEQKAQTLLRAPEWSLGKHTRTATLREQDNGDNDAAAKKRPIRKVIEYFEGGRHCDENGAKRSTAVHIQCCEGTNHKNFIPADMYYSAALPKGVKLPSITLVSVAEPSTCQYEMTVCSPLLCPPPLTWGLNRDGGKGMTQHSEDSTATAAVAAPQLTAVMKRINGTCLNKQEDWWTYELCFNAGIRQVRYEIEQSVTAEGKLVHKNILVSQYQLGLAPTDLYSSESEINQRVMGAGSAPMSPTELAILEAAGMVTPTFRTRGRDPRYISLLFDDGTPCDLDTVNRSTIVDLYCGPKNRLISIWEDSTCHYHVKVEIADLCAIRDFRPFKENTSVVAFTELQSEYEESVGSEEIPSNEHELGHEQKVSSNDVNSDDRVPIIEDVVEVDTSASDPTTTGDHTTNTVEVLEIEDNRNDIHDNKDDVEVEVEVEIKVDGVVQSESKSKSWSNRPEEVTVQHEEEAEEEEEEEEEAEEEEAQERVHTENEDVDDIDEVYIPDENEILHNAAKAGVDDIIGRFNFGLIAHGVLEQEAELRLENALPAEHTRYNIKFDLVELSQEYPEFDLVQFAIEFHILQNEDLQPWEADKDYVRALIEESIKSIKLQDKEVEKGDEEEMLLFEQDGEYVHEDAPTAAE